jgi:hypothetical protein
MLLEAFREPRLT